MQITGTIQKRLLSLEKQLEIWKTPPLLFSQFAAV